MTQPIDRYATALELGFDEVAANSIGAVSDRDFVIELVADLALIMMHLSRLCEEVVLWAARNSASLNSTTPTARAAASCPRRKTPTWPS